MAVACQRRDCDRAGGLGEVVRGVVKQPHRRRGVFVADLDDLFGTGIDDLHGEWVGHAARDAVDEGSGLRRAHRAPGREGPGVGRRSLRYDPNDRGA
jgi:hypothetical protein